MARLLLNRYRMAAAVALLALVSSSASAQVVYNNGPLNGNGGNEFTQWIQAESFAFAAPQTITGFTFWSNSNDGTYDAELTWLIYNDSADAPGSVLLSDTVSFTRVADGTNNAGRTVFRTDIVVPTTNLAAGTYWLGLHNGPLTNTDRAEIYWSTTDANTTAAGLEDENPFGVGGWGSSGQEHAFFISGPTANAVAPEPGSLALLSLAALPVASAFLRRRGRR